MIDSIITDVFQGQFFTSVKCINCNYDNISFDNFLSLSLSLPESSSYSNRVTIDDCLQEFIKNESISEKEGFRCDGCKKVTDIIKKTVIWRLPSILILHLKRFRCSGWSKSKLETTVKFELKNFDLKPYCGHSGTLI